jgi:hypothetical protein
VSWWSVEVTQGEQALEAPPPRPLGCGESGSAPAGDDLPDPPDIVGSRTIGIRAPPSAISRPPPSESEDALKLDGLSRLSTSRNKAPVRGYLRVAGWADEPCDAPDRHPEQPPPPTRIRHSRPCRSDGPSRVQTTALRALAEVDPSSPRRRRRPLRMVGRSPSRSRGVGYPNRRQREPARRFRAGCHADASAASPPQSGFLANGTAFQRVPVSLMRSLRLALRGVEGSEKASASPQTR